MYFNEPVANSPTEPTSLWDCMPYVVDELEAGYRSINIQMTSNIKWEQVE